jgi:hypothetical protein
MFVLKTLIDKYTQQGSKHLYTCFVDFCKAFDTVWHIGLLYKLRNSGVSDIFHNVIKHMYENTLHFLNLLTYLKMKSLHFYYFYLNF